MAGRESATVRTAHELADASKVPLPTVSKILKELCRAGLVVSHRGRRGGYSLSRPADAISVAEIVEALDGPLGLTECATSAGACSLEETCVARTHWGPISRAIHRTLSRLPLSSLGPRPARPGRLPIVGVNA
jgi:Rrf2 family protein